MSLIFSNETRILFNNKENADQLLELSYGNRVTALKKTKVLCKSPNTSFFFRGKDFLHVPPQNFYKTKHVTREYTSCFATVVSAGFPGSLTHKSFGVGMRIFNLQAMPMSFVQGKSDQLRWHASLASPSAMQVIDRVSPDASLQSKDASHARRAKRSTKGVDLISLQTKDDSILPWTRQYEYNSVRGLICKGKSMTNAKLRFASGPSSKKCKTGKHRTFRFNKSFFSKTNLTSHLQSLAMQTRGVKALFDQTLKYKGLQNPEEIKTLLPTIKIRDFAFGSSFLFIIMTTILQRQEQNAWCFQFLKCQIPGVSQVYQESSLECFENITNSYINRGDIKQKTRLNVSKDLYVKKATPIKNLSCCKNNLYLDFTKPWTQQLNRDFGSIFSKDISKVLLYKKNHDQKSKSVEHKWMVPAFYKMHARIPNYFLIENQKPGIASSKRFSNFIINNRIFKENDTIPSKMSCSANTIFTDRYKLRIEKQNKSPEKRRNIERKNDVLKKFFYEYGIFSIPTQALQYKKTSSTVLDPKIFDKLTRKNQVDTKLVSFDLSLAAIDFEKLALIKNVSSSDEDKFFIRPQLQKQIGKMSCYAFYNTFSKGDGTLCNRFLSGYKKPEVRLRTFCKSDTVFIRTGIKNVHRLKLPLQNLNNVMTFRQRVKMPLQIRVKTLSFYNNKVSTEKLSHVQSQKGLHANTIKAYKKLPYKKLALSEHNEVKPLFEKINKEIRMSPHKVTFKRPLFIDYNDYLNRHKDSPAAIAISPSLEEDKAIDQSWDEYLERENLVNRSLEKSNLLSATDYAENSPLSDPGTKGYKSSICSATKNEVLEEKLHDKLTESGISLPYNDLNTEDNTNTATSLDLQNESLHDKSINEEDKKREITKWEWLHNVRDSEASIEERKDLRKFAYPNKDALFTKHLKPKAGAIKNILVGDRKSSFFGITNIFPKRLIAKDQKQINDQILREDYDQRSVEIFESDNTHFFKFDPLISGQAEQFLSCKSKASPLKNYNAKEETPPYVWKQGNYVQVTKGDPLYGELRPQEITTVRDSFAQKGAWGSPSIELRIVPRQNNTTKFNVVVSNSRQHPIYRPSRRLRLRVAELSKENNNTQSRVDALNAYQSHRWWQKRRIDSSLLGAPSTRYMVIPEITKEDWKKIIEWQLKTYFLEEEKRLQPLILEKMNKADRFSSVSSLENGQKSQSQRRNVLLMSKEKRFQETLHNFKIKKIAIYLPWITLKKNLKKPYEWPLTRLTSPSITDHKLPKRGFFDFVQVQKVNFSCTPNGESNVLLPIQQNVFLNKKPYAFFISAISPQFKAHTLRLPKAKLSGFYPLQSKANADTKIKEGYNLNDSLLILNKEKNNFVSGYKPFLFEVVTKDSHLVIHQLLLAVAIKYIFQKIYHLFEKIVIDRVKNSSLEIALLRFAPFLFNPYSRENQAPGLYKLQKRLKDLIGSEDAISSLSEIVWYLRNSCRGRMIPRGVVLLESDNSESTEFLKAIGGEAQVPVIVQSLRALPFTQSHPQRRLEKILKFAEKQAPCILFLDDLDSIGQSRTALLNQNNENWSTSKTLEQKGIWKRNVIGTKSNGRGQCIRNPLLNRKDFSLGNEKGKWTNYNNAQRACPEGIGFIFNSESHNQKQNNKFLRTSSSSPSFAMPFDQGKKPSSSIYNNFTYTEGVRQRTGTCKQGVPNQRKSNFKLSVSLEPAMDMQSLALQDNAKITIQQSSPVPETEKIIEQRRLDLMLRLLTVMDGISHLKGVLIVTTSKNPSSLDPALLRPGRFEKFINLKLPNKKRRIELLKVHTSKIGHTIPMPWEYLGTETQNMTGTAISDAINHSAFQAIIQSTPHTLSTLEYGLSRVNGKGFQGERVPLAGETQKSLNRYTYASSQGKRIREPSLRFPSKFYLRSNKTKNGSLKHSQISFYNAGQSITQSLFKQEGLGFQNYNTNIEDCAQNIIKLYTGQAAESLYLNSTVNLKNQSFQLVNLKKKTSALSALNVNGYVRNSTHKLIHYALADKNQLEATTLMSFIPKINHSFSLPHKLEILDFKTKPRKYFQFNQVHNSTSSLLKQHLAFQGFERNKDSLFQSKTCATLQNFNRSAGHWYRLYLPKIERNKNNREWLIPDRFANQHISLLDLNSIKPNKEAKSTNLSQYARKERLSLALNGFYVAFQNLNEHRELLDLLADHLIRFKFFRSHEILRISSFYVNTNQRVF